MRPGGLSQPDGAPTADSWDWDDLCRFVHVCARRRAQDVTIAEDVAQEVLVDLVRKASAVRFPRAWAAAAVRRLLKKIERRLEVSVTSYLDDSLAASLEDPTDRIFRREVLSGLAESHTLVISLSDAGFLQREIAGVMHCSTCEVGPRLARAHRAARKFAHSAE